MELDITPHLTLREKLQRQLWRMKQRRAIGQAGNRHANLEITQTPNDGTESENAPARSE